MIFLYTFEYETGVFIFDSKTNTYNQDNFFKQKDNKRSKNPTIFTTYNDNGDIDEKEVLPEITNIFENLHNTDIPSIEVYNNEIILCIDNSISKYNPANDSLTKIFEFKDRKMKISHDIIFGLNKNIISMYKLDGELIKFIEICDTEHFVSYFEIYDEQLIIMSKKYVNPYGQIYKSDHKDDCEASNLTISIYNISSL